MTVASISLGEWGVLYTTESRVSLWSKCEVVPWPNNASFWGLMKLWRMYLFYVEWNHLNARKGSYCSLSKIILLFSDVWDFVSLYRILVFTKMDCIAHLWDTLMLQTFNATLRFIHLIMKVVWRICLFWREICRASTCLYFGYLNMWYNCCDYYPGFELSLVVDFNDNYFLI